MDCVYSRNQVDQFLIHIGLPERLRNVSPCASLLAILHIHMLSTVPYENLSIHYNAKREVILDPQHLFQKIVVDNRGRGGYCMENAILYNHMLRGLGFDAYTAGVRTRTRTPHGVPEGDFPGWVHIVSIVSLPEGKYHVDIAFGGDCATKPLPLISGLEHHNFGTQQIRLVRDWISTQNHRVEESKQWIYEYRNNADDPWMAYYCFPELEFMPADWNVVNWWVSGNPRHHQMRNVLCILFLRRRQKEETGTSLEEEEICGKRMIHNGVVKENLGDKSTTIEICHTEEERINALEKYFGLYLTPEEKKGIEGYVSDLGGR